MLAIFHVGLRAAKVYEMHFCFFQIVIIEQVLVLVIFFKALQLLTDLKTDHCIEVLETIVVVSLIIGSEHDVVCLDIKVHISQRVELFDAVYHLDTHFQNVNFSEVQVVTF